MHVHGVQGNNPLIFILNGFYPFVSQIVYDRSLLNASTFTKDNQWNP